MVTAISATEAKNRFGAVLDRVAEGGDEIIVERQGKPQAAIISIADFEDFQHLREQRRRQEAVETIRRVRAQVRARNLDLTDEEAEAIADSVTRDAVNALIAKGAIRFEDE